MLEDGLKSMRDQIKQTGEVADVICKRMIVKHYGQENA
jgi:hypothetical protein